MTLSRSEQMARIRGRDTSAELRLRRTLHARGLRYRVDHATGRGRADLVFTRRHIAVFVDGCFWHGCPDHYVRPRTRSEFWASKLKANVLRDRRQTLELEARGWRVLRFWECEVLRDTDRVASRILRCWKGGSIRGAARRMCVLVARPIDDAGTRERRDLVDLRDATVRESIECLRASKPRPRR